MQGFVENMCTRLGRFDFFRYKKKTRKIPQRDSFRNSFDLSTEKNILQHILPLTTCIAMKTAATTHVIRRKIAPLSIKLGMDKKAQLIWIAEKKDRSVHFLLCQAVSEYIENETKRLAFYEDGRKAIEHYNETGLHTTHAEMMAWAQSLGTEHELPLPPCHK